MVDGPGSPSTDCGAITAEFALLLPAAVALLVVGLGIGSVQLQQLRLAQDLSLLARQVEAGVGQAEVARSSAALGLALNMRERAGLLCLEAKKTATLLGLGDIPLTDAACALPPGR